ncbi:MAG: hypothetical protein AVDCRST_MAG85-848, partial [uncultured Solirubrobacteraceae bacterium]
GRRVVHLRGAVAGAGGRPRPAGRGARLRVGLRHAHQRPRVADGARALRLADRPGEGRHRRRADLHADAGDDGADRGDDRRDRRRPLRARPRRQPPARRRGLARPDDRQARVRDARVRRDPARDLPRRGAARRRREVADGVPARDGGPALPADLRRWPEPEHAPRGGRVRRRRDPLALQPQLHPRRRRPRGHRRPREGGQDARGLRHRRGRSKCVHGRSAGRVRVDAQGPPALHGPAVLPRDDRAQRVRRPALRLRRGRPERRRRRDAGGDLGGVHRRADRGRQRRRRPGGHSALPRRGDHEPERRPDRAHGLRGDAARRGSPL